MFRNRNWDNKEEQLSVPKRWIVCPCYGGPINATIYNENTPEYTTCFVPLKAPLGEKFRDMLWDKHQFPFSKFKEEEEEQGRKCIAIINLTNTKNYYEESELDPSGTSPVRLIRIPCRGHGESPSEEEFQRFAATIHEIGQLQPNQFIAVHCTHGFNRTGFCIVRFLIEKCRYILDDALKAFANSRSPGILKQDYLNDLCTIYNRPMGSFSAPSYDWYHPDPQTLNSCTFEDLKSEETDKNDILENYGESRLTIPTVKIQNAVCDICNTSRARGPRGISFPGSNPVSLTLENIHFLDEYEYKATYKSDGVRYFLYAFEGETYIINRKFVVKKVNVNCLTRKGERMQNTLLDGELVFEGEQLKFLIFDVLCFEGLRLLHNTWGNRMLYATKGIVPFREMWRAKNPALFDGEDFEIGNKRQFALSELDTLQDFIDHEVKHKTDGIILTPMELEFVPRACEQILKAKPIELNSTDFKAEFFNDVCYLSVFQPGAGRDDQGEDIPISILEFENEEMAEPFRRGPTILECVLPLKTQDLIEDPDSLDSAGWLPIRTRGDKNTANVYKTFIGVFQSIKDNLWYDQIREHARR